MDRNSIVEQLQALRQQLMSMRKNVEQQLQLHETTAAQQAALVRELEDIIEWLYNHEAEIQSRPLLLIPVASVEAELEKHEVNYYSITASFFIYEY